MIRNSFRAKDKKANKTLHRSRKFPGPPRLPGNFSEVWETGTMNNNRHREGKVRKPGLASLETTFGMVIASKTLVSATPPRPGQDSTCGRRRGPDEPCKQMAHFWNSQGEHRRLAGRPRGRQRDSGAAGGCANAWKVGKSDQHKRDVPVPADETAHFVVVQTQIFSVFKLSLNGLITNDKFCMSRTARLQLSWWRLPRNARQTISAGVESPVTGNTEEYLPQQEAHEETTMDRSASLRGTA
jgi:hypothetical protein